MLHFVKLERSVVDPLASCWETWQEQRFSETDTFSAAGDGVFV